MSIKLILISILFTISLNSFVLSYERYVQCGSGTCDKELHVLRCLKFSGCLGNGCQYSSGNPCDQGECNYRTCTNNVGCSTQTVASNSRCNDGLACTNDICTPSGCTNEPIVCENSPNLCLNSTGCNAATGVCETVPVNCDDGNLCTNDQCTETGHCTHTPIVCPNPGNCQTSTGCNAATGVCETTPVICNDGVDCTDDVCNPTTGCTPALNSTKCDDNDMCTTNQCTSSGCVFTNVTCPPAKFLDLLGLGLLCCVRKCDPITGGCVRDFAAAPLPLLLCL